MITTALSFFTYIFNLMSTYLSLTNELLRRMGEVVVDVTDFDGARNIQALAKTAINSSVREILHTAQEWPFLLSTESQTLTAGTGTYSFPPNTSSVNWESFYLKQHPTAGNNPGRLKVITYVDYLNNYRPRDDSNGESGRGAPTVVYQTNDLKFGVSPLPSVDFVIEYQYFSYPDDMVTSTDSCIIPSRFDNIVIDGAMFYMLMYRSNEQGANIYREKFDLGIRSMRRLLMDDPLYVTSTVVTRQGYSSSSFTNV